MAVAGTLRVSAAKQQCQYYCIQILKGNDGGETNMRTGLANFLSQIGRRRAPQVYVTLQLLTTRRMTGSS